MTLQSMTQAQAEPVPVHGMSVLLSRDQLPEARRITGRTSWIRAAHSRSDASSYGEAYSREPRRPARCIDDAKAADTLGGHARAGKGVDRDRDAVGGRRHEHAPSHPALHRRAARVALR